VGENKENIDIKTKSKSLEQEFYINGTIQEVGSYYTRGGKLLHKRWEATP